MVSSMRTIFSRHFWRMTMSTDKQTIKEAAKDHGTAHSAAAHGIAGQEPLDKVRPVKMVKMKRAHPQHPGGPTTADVHPEEVENYSQGGWVSEE
jgi:hypothetical protein